MGRRRPQPREQAGRREHRANGSRGPVARSTFAAVKAMRVPSGEIAISPRIVFSGRTSEAWMGGSGCGVWRTQPAKNAAAIATVAKAPHARRSRLLRRAVTGDGHARLRPALAIHCSCSFTSCAVCNRSSGSLARQRRDDAVERGRRHRRDRRDRRRARPSGSRRSGSPGSSPRTPSCPVAIS